MLKMITTLSISCWIFLMSFAAVMLIPESEGQGGIAIGCCPKFNKGRIKGNIMECYEQTTEMGCSIDVYLVITTEKQKYCVPKSHPKLKMYLKEKKECLPLIKPTKLRLKAMQEDVLE